MMAPLNAGVGIYYGNKVTSYIYPRRHPLRFLAK
jgi:hypothetical protein